MHICYIAMYFFLTSLYHQSQHWFKFCVKIEIAPLGIHQNSQINMENANHSANHNHMRVRIGLKCMFRVRAYLKAPFPVERVILFARK